jgi:hypothetical protein
MTCQRGASFDGQQDYYCRHRPNEHDSGPGCDWANGGTRSTGRWRIGWKGWMIKSSKWTMYDVPRMTESPRRNNLLEHRQRDGPLSQINANTTRTLTPPKHPEHPAHRGKVESSQTDRGGTHRGGLVRTRHRHWQHSRDEPVLVHWLLVFSFWCFDPHLRESAGSLFVEPSSIASPMHRCTDVPIRSNLHNSGPVTRPVSLYPDSPLP